MRGQAAVRSRRPGPSGTHTLREPVKGGRGWTPGYQEAGREGGPIRDSRGLGGAGRLGQSAPPARGGPIPFYGYILYRRAGSDPEWFLTTPVCGCRDPMAIASRRQYRPDV